MTRENINGSKFMKRKIGAPLSVEEKKMIENGELVFSFYATDYLYYKVIK